MADDPLPETKLIITSTGNYLYQNNYQSLGLVRASNIRSTLSILQDIYCRDHVDFVHHEISLQLFSIFCRLMLLISPLLIGEQATGLQPYHAVSVSSK